MACNKQFENLFTILDHSNYDIDTPFKKVIQEAVEKAGFCNQKGEETSKGKKGLGKKGGKTEKKTQKNTGKKTQKIRKTSSYNLFVGHQMKNEGQSMGEAVALWKELGEKEKMVWKEKASVLDLEKEAELKEEKKKSQEKSKKKSSEKSDEKGKQSKKSRKTSGYNLFLGDLMKNKGKKMGEAVGLWNELSDKERLVWKEKAIALNQEKKESVDSEETISM